MWPSHERLGGTYVVMVHMMRLTRQRHDSDMTTNPDWPGEKPITRFLQIGYIFLHALGDFSLTFTCVDRA